MQNHYFIQGFLERDEDERDFNKVTPDCLAAVDALFSPAPAEAGTDE